MSYMHPAALEARRKYWTRPDAYRFAPPGTPEAQMPGWLDPSATRVRWKEAQEEEARRQAKAAQEEFDRELADLWASHERAREELAEVKYELAWRRILRKFRPDQPRVPAGNPDGGQWTGGNGSSGARAAASEDSSRSDGIVLSDATPDPTRAGDQFAKVIAICMLNSQGISTDAAGNQSWRGEYVCADGFTFWRLGLGGKVPGFRRDPR